MAGRKRVYAFPMGTSTRPYKRRKFSRKRRTRMKKSTAYTTQSGAGSSLYFKRRRKISRKAYKRKLWNDSLASTHYRSVAAESAEFSTPVSTVTSVVGVVPAVNNGSNFWTSAGGAVDPDGGAMPTFKNDILLRGGKIGITFCNEGTQPKSLKIYLIRAGDNPSVTLSSPQPVGWDPTVEPDFSSEFGRVIYSREYVMEVDGSCSTEYRLSIQKIDQSNWGVNSRQLFWVFACCNLADATASAFQVTKYYNLSFSGDVIS